MVDQVVRLFNLYGPARKPGVLQRIAARLVFDNLIQPQPAGVRRSGSLARQSLYRADQWDIDLAFEPGVESGTIDIIGQILRGHGTTDDVTGLPVHLVQGENTLASMVTDHLGEFSFDQVVSGIYGLRIDLGDRQVTIEHIDVKLSE
jgi:hypothetical protein